MKDLVLMDINCKDARSFRLVTGKLFLCIKVIIRDLSEISRGGGGWEQREGHNVLRLQERKGS